MWDGGACSCYLRRVWNEAPRNERKPRRKTKLVANKRLIKEPPRTTLSSLSHPNRLLQISKHLKTIGTPTLAISINTVGHQADCWRRSAWQHLPDGCRYSIFKRNEAQRRSHKHKLLIQNFLTVQHWPIILPTAPRPDSRHQIPMKHQHDSTTRGHAAVNRDSVVLVWAIERKSASVKCRKCDRLNSIYKSIEPWSGQSSVPNR